ncbi:Lrp/AsnC ligand binding domain-containing protein [Apibacter sp.]|uniref:Lrp/AsnC ligand binding domain-containing protein n=1 Tax=Apibacter sp. TaxID=2023709 RepID=UPI0025DFEAE6|nr:Lrp/AsnC ligand binding domain-containing protein [Apibacter sp.]MCT6869921.1 Lrp/AsnC ligand binding domain-containing protein [Apibacter sp.]
MRISDLHTIELDGIDKIILKALMENSKAPVSNIARQVGVSSTAIHQRIKKLEAAKIIEDPITPLNYKLLGYKTTAYVGIFLEKSAQYQEAIMSMMKIPEIIEAHFTTGNYAIFIKILCKDNDHLMSVLRNEIQNIKGIERTETIISLEQSISRQIIP